MALSLKHQAFVDEYLKDHNITRAALKAGYSEKTARVSGSRLLTRADIQAVVRERATKASELADVTVASVLRKIEDLYAAAMTAGQYSAAAKAIEMQGRYLAMFTDNHRVTIAPDEREARLRAIFERN